MILALLKTGAINGYTRLPERTRRLSSRKRASVDGLAAGARSSVGLLLHNRWILEPTTAILDDNPTHRVARVSPVLLFLILRWACSSVFSMIIRARFYVNSHLVVYWMFFF